MECPSASVAGTASGGESRVELGRVARPHGLAGGLLVLLHGDDPANLARAAEVTLEGNPGEISFRVRRVEDAGRLRGGRARVRLWLEGVTQRADAELWAGASVSVLEQVLAPLPEGEFYWRDLIGLRCRVVGGSLLGLVEEIWPTGSNDVLVVREGDRTLLIPALESVIVRLDSRRGEVLIDPPEGLLDADADPDRGGA